MSDPLEDRLRDFAAGAPDGAVTPAAPAEIRCRGDRLRRRRTALTVAGAALAVAVVATPVAVLGSRDGETPPAVPPSATDTPPDTTPDPTDAPAPPPVARVIPSDFPLTSGYPALNEDGTTVEVTSMPGVESVQPCDRTAWAPPADALDVAGASFLGAEDGRSRTLVLYADAEAAASAVTSVRDGVADCPVDGDEADGSAWAEADSPYSEDSVVVTRRYLTGGQPNPGLEVYQAVRVGNAVLVDVNYGEGGATDQTVAAFTDVVVDQATEVVAAMTTFDDDTDDTGDTGDTGVPQLPASFLPGPGDLPTRDRLTPWREVEATDDRLVGCQPDVGVGAERVVTRSYAARAAAVDGAPEGDGNAAEVRVTILQYASTTEGEAAEAAVTGWIRDCPDPGDPALDRATGRGDLVDTDAGTYATWTYAATEVCADCDATWFDSMGVLADQGRMVVVSFRELAGPVEPDGLDIAMQELMLHVAGRSMPG